MHPNILDNKTAGLLVVDIQEGFRSVIPSFAVMASRASTAVQGFLTLGRPVYVTEQYPKGLGPTAEEIRLALPDGYETFEKTAFSGCGATSFVDQLTAAGVSQVVLCGIEAHICVNQTAHDLVDRGFQVHVLTDAVSSRFEHDKQAGLAKMREGGVLSSSVEMAFFEMLQGASHPHFKEVQALIR